MADPYGRNAVTEERPRCWRCGKLLAELVTQPWLIVCYRCKATNAGGAATSARVRPPGVDDTDPNNG